ncbi:MAG: type II toxin-antitoxin system Phd/YefM family antitoxin [Cellulomonas sp.]|jgi:prevent-host-death family protein|nr:type II toxin-antitoxin system Phd/YefM family antitoxin [Cellulomonas sp.]
MSTTTVTAAEFNRWPSRVRRQAAKEPVVVTDHDRPTVVVLPYETYVRLCPQVENLADWLAADDGLDVDFQPLTVGLRPADL